MFIKLNFNKQEFFNPEKNKDEKLRSHVKVIIDSFFKIYDTQYLENTVHEAEKNRLTFIEIYYLFLEKYLKFNNFSLKTSSKEEVTNFKIVLSNVETYFLNQIYDSNVEVRKMAILLFSLVLKVFPQGEFFNPLANKYQEMKRQEENELFLLEALQYIGQEEEMAALYFKNLVKIFTILTTLLIDEKINLGTLLEQCLKNILQKFPVISVNELIKNKIENRVSRVEALDKVFKKYMKQS